MLDGEIRHPAILLRTEPWNSLMKSTLKAVAATAVAIPLIAAAPPSEKSNLEKQLALLSGADGEETQAGSSGPQSPPATGWIHPKLAGKATAPCAMSFRDGINTIGYIGPSKDWNESYFFVTGPSIPQASTIRSVRVRLATDGDADQTVKAFHYRISARKSAIMFKLTDFGAALDAMEDVEDIAIVLMEPEDPQYQQAIFSGRWVDGHAARDKIRVCLAGAG